MNPWRLYVMIAPADGAARHFKIGVSSSLLRRLGEVQTGCPVPIEALLSVTLGDKQSAEGAEKGMHSRLADYRTSGEWFRLEMDNPEHKRAFNEAARRTIDLFLGAGWKWEEADVSALRRYFREPDGMRRDLRRQNLAHAYRLGKGMPMW